MDRLLKLVLILLISTTLASCSVKRAATTMTANMINDGMSAVESESDLWIAKESVPPLVKVIEVLKAADPNNPTFSALMAKVYGNIAFGFFEPRFFEASVNEKGAWKARIERYYRLGYENGLLAMQKRFGKGIGSSVMDFEAAIKKAKKKKDLTLLFWTAFDLGNLVNLNRDDIASVANMPKATAMIDRVVEVDPSFAYGSALAFKAAMMASKPAMLGGNPEKAPELFEKAINLTDGKYLMNKVMYAEWYAIPQKDIKLAKELLTEVINSTTAAVPGQELANQLAKERAKILVGKLGS